MPQTQAPADQAALLAEIVELLSEQYDPEGYVWTHAHCDEDSGGIHRLDHDWLDEDIMAWLKKARA